MIYINDNKLIRSYINNYNKSYIGDKLLYWNIYINNEESLCYTYDLNNQWQYSTLSLDGHIVLESFSNYNQHSSVSRMRIYLNGCETFNFKYYSDGESNYDYTIIGKLDTDLSSLNDNTVTSTTYTQYTTKGKQQQWLDATFTIPNDGQEHFIDVVYRKDSSANSGADKGYIAIMQPILAEKWKISETDYIKTNDSYYTKEYKYVTFDNKTWVATSEYREGYQLNTDTIKTDEYLCDNGNKYEKLQIVFIDHPYISAINEYTTGDLIEENAVECQWITLTFDTDKTIPMQRFRIDATDPQTSGYYFIRFSSTPNGSFTNTRFSICPDEGIIFDNGTRKNITDQINIEGNIYEYTFSVPIYFADAEQNAPVSQVKYQPI